MATNTSLVDYFVKIEGLAGTTFDKQMTGAFEIKDFSFGVENPTTIGSATGGAGAGKIKFNEFTIKKTSDQASPLFFKSCASGVHYKKATLYCRKAGGDPSTSGGLFLKVEFSDVLVSSYEQDGVGTPPSPVLQAPVDAALVAPTDTTGLGSAGDPVDDIALNYSKLAMTSNPTTISVAPSAGGMLAFDPKTNTFDITESPDGVLTVGTQGGVSSRGVQEFDVSSVLPLLNAGAGTLTLTVNEVRETPPSLVTPPDPDLHFDVILYGPADLALSAEDLTREGKLLGSLHIQPRRDPASLELNFTNEVREAALGTFGIRIQLRGTPIAGDVQSGPGDEGPEELVGHDASASFTLDVRFDSN